MVSADRAMYSLIILIYKLAAVNTAQLRKWDAAFLTCLHVDVCFPHDVVQILKVALGATVIITAVEPLGQGERGR
jgi:hypothetical protein